MSNEDKVYWLGGLRVDNRNDICDKSRGSFTDDQTKCKYPIVKDAAKCAMFKVR